MDDIVVIILTILVAVVGALSQRKKRQQAEAAKKNPGVQSQPNQPFDFWEMLREESTPVHPFDEPEPVMENLMEEHVDTVPEPKPVYRFSAKDEGSSDIKESIVEAPQKKRYKVLIDGEKFSLRKAVIYSEIMNRKYS